MMGFLKIEKVARDVAICNFFLMFGYKLFSVFYSLFLLEKGFSLPEIGYNYLFIYFSIAIFALIVGFLNHKINPAILMSCGILGYGIYALGMIFIEPGVFFYLFQVLLGISAALFFASSRAILTGSNLKNYDKAYGFFYSTPIYAAAFAPAIGALIISQFNFSSVFIFSLIIHVLTAIFCFLRLRGETKNLVDDNFKLKQLEENYKKVFGNLKSRNVSVPTAVSFAVILVSGFYFAFFVVFLKDLGWVQNKILFLESVFSFVFLPFSIFLINKIGKQKSVNNVLRGGFFSGVFTLLIGVLAIFSNFALIVFLMTGRSAGTLMCGSGRSSIISKNFREKPEEAGAIDTIFNPLGIALGSLLGGFIAVSFGFSYLFIGGGIFVILVVSLSRVLLKDKIKFY